MKRFLLLAVLLLSTGVMKAQLSIDNILDGLTHGAGSDYVKQAVMPELSIIRQQYRLERNGEFYGKNNKAFYGESYSLGVKVSGGMLLAGSVIRPWEDDADYQRVNASNAYKPVYFWSYQRSMTDSVYTAVELELQSAHTKVLTTDSTLYYHSDIRCDFGLTIDETAGPHSGTLLWVYASNPQDSALTVSFKQASERIEIRSDSTLIAVEPTNPEKLLGGIYVVPKYETGGRVQFQLAGVAVKIKPTEWKLQLLVRSNSESPNSEQPSKKQEVETKGSAEPTKTK